MTDPRLIFPNGLTTKQARRLADIGDALNEGGIEVEALVDASLYDFGPAPICEGCACQLEAGHCYCCFPVFGYGDRFQEQRHGPDFRPVFKEAKP